MQHVSPPTGGSCSFRPPVLLAIRHRLEAAKAPKSPCKEIFAMGRCIGMAGGGTSTGQPPKQCVGCYTQQGITSAQYGI